MHYDITQVRKDMTEYRRRFSEKWQEVYGYPFQHEVLRAKRMLQNWNSHEALDFATEYQDRIRNIKNLIEHDKH